MNNLLKIPLLRLSGQDVWTIGDSFEGTQVFGATGSGKTSGSGHAIAKAMLRAGFGGLVLTAKDDVDLWKSYCQEAGRGEHLIVVDETAFWRFNFLDYELNRAGRGGGFTANVVELFTTAAEVTGGQNRQGSNDPYWQNSLRQLLTNAVELVAAATGKVSLQDIYAVIAEAPQSHEAVHDESWQANSRCWALLSAANEKAEAGGFSDARRQDFELTARYWLAEHPALADKTRSIIVSLFTSMADGILRRPFRSLFCSDTSFVPEMAFSGAIILLALPTLSFGTVGRTAQVLMKRVFQDAVQRRDISKHLRPVFLWADEAQLFITANDQTFQTTARSSRCASVYLTQNLPNYVAALGGDRMRVESLLGNLQTKIFHANSDSITNQWASELISREEVLKTTLSKNDPRGVEQPHSSGGVSLSKSWEPIVPAVAFTRLAKGGAASGSIVEGVCFQSGRRWAATGSTHINVRFRQ